MSELVAGIPTSPKNIPASASLESLEKIRTAWISDAREQKIPEKLFEIGRWLGSRDPDNRGDFRCLTIGDIIIWTGIKTAGRNVEKDAWNARRRVTVFSGRDLLVRWEWSYIVQDLCDDPIDPKEVGELLFIPGNWLASALAMQDKAEAARIGFARNAETAERDNLARRLLVGMEV